MFDIVVSFINVLKTGEVHTDPSSIKKISEYDYSRIYYNGSLIMFTNHKTMKTTIFIIIIWNIWIYFMQ